MLLSWLLSSFPGAVLLFLSSLGIVMLASAHFTRRLEALCNAFNLSIGVLSLLSALGANIPNYVSSGVAIVRGQTDLGLGIILGSNIYNITIILGVCILFTPTYDRITLGTRAKRYVGMIAWDMCVITLSVWGLSAFLPGSPLMGVLPKIQQLSVLFWFTALLTLCLFGRFLTHMLRHSHGHAKITGVRRIQTPLALLRLGSEILCTLTLALGGVVVMVQSGQVLTNDVHLPAVLAGLLVLAVATSLPNTIVAISLVRTGEVAACVAEICSSASINLVLGVALPVVVWQGALQDRLLILLDNPFLVVLTSGVLFYLVKRGTLPRHLGVVLLCCYLIWVIIRSWVS